LLTRQTNPSCELTILEPQAHLAKKKSSPTLTTRPRFIVTLKDKNTGTTYEEAFDTILYGTGRAADTFGLNLEAVGIKANPRSGKIPTDDCEAVAGSPGSDGTTSLMIWCLT